MVVANRLGMLRTVAPVRNSGLFAPKTAIYVDLHLKNDIDARLTLILTFQENGKKISSSVHIICVPFTLQSCTAVEKKTQ